MKEIIQAASRFAQDHGYYPDTILLGTKEFNELVDSIDWYKKNETSMTSESPDDFEYQGLKVIQVNKESYLRAVI